MHACQSGLCHTGHCWLVQSCCLSPQKQPLPKYTGVTSSELLLASGEACCGAGRSRARAACGQVATAKAAAAASRLQPASTCMGLQLSGAMLKGEPFA